jgi:hypothetical protein
MPVTIELVPDDPAADVPAQLTEVAEFLRAAGVPYAGVAEADLGSGETPLVPLLTTAADLLHPQNTAVRFPRTRLVHALVTMELSRSAGKEELGDVLKRKLREYGQGTSSAPALGTTLAGDVLRAGPSRHQMLFTLLGGLVDRFSPFWFTRLGRASRWLRRQRKQRKAPTNFTTFALALTRSHRNHDNDDIEFLAVHAFLEDLRVAYRPRLWWPPSWYWVRRPVLILDGLSEALPVLLARARRLETARPDPLLVMVVPRSRDAKPKFACEPIGIPSQLGDPRRAPCRANRPWLAVATLAALLGSVVTAVVVLWLGPVTGSPIVGPRPALAPVPTPALVAAPLCSAAGTGDDVAPWGTKYDMECVGYSSTSFTFANGDYYGESNQQRIQDARIEADQRQIFYENRQVDESATPGSRRTVVELVYFAGLTEGPYEDYDTAEAEELEGLLAAQELTLTAREGPLLKIVVANGGSKMQDAVAVTKMLIPLFKKDPHLLGVVGMDRSITAVQQAIALFTRNRIPVVATTLSADGIGGGNPYYFQLPPSNTSEARLMLQYIRAVVPRYFELPHGQYNSGGFLAPTRIVIYEPEADPSDLYISSLLHDLTQEAETPEFSGLPRPHATSQLGTGLSGAGLCGDSTVDIYAGRHDRPLSGSSQYDDFTQFLQKIAQHCANGQTPFIIADDGVTRFVADPVSREEQGIGNAYISYVTKGISILQTGSDCLHSKTAANYSGQFGMFCQQYVQIVNGLLSQPATRGLSLLWTGERVGLAYDAAELFLSVEDAGLIPAAGIPAQFTSSGPFVGVTGTIDFSHSHIGPLPPAIVRIELSSKMAMPTCEYPADKPGYVYGPDPNDGSCPNERG